MAGVMAKMAKIGNIGGSNGGSVISSENNGNGVMA
jgi:hypothetical protein